MNELWQALYNRLTGAAAITAQLSSGTAVYDTQAPAGAAYPLIIFQQQAWPVETVDPRRREDAYVLIKAISPNSFAEAGRIDAAIDAALDGKLLTVAGHVNIWCRRTEQIRYLETDPAGKNYYHAGGIYRIRLAH